MNISVELSMYPLCETYGTPILTFIDRLKSHAGITVSTNSMSTQVFGPYEVVMEVLNKEMKHAFEGENTVVMVAKFANIDLKP